LNESNTFRAEIVTLVPALLVLVLAIYLSGLAIYVVKESSEQRLYSTLGAYTFIGGIALAVCWGVYWGLHRKLTGKERLHKSG